MSEHHHPRKRFGQHFLTDARVIQNIVRALNPQPTQNLVEIGAGTGALTARVLDHVSHLHVVEIDRDLVKHLQQSYPESLLSVHQHDALNFDFRSLVVNNEKLRVFGNLPYNISTPLLFHLLQYAPFIADMLFMLQKEVIDRICASPGTRDYGRLSIMIQYDCETQKLFDISPNAFSPPPKVMSSLVYLRPYHGERPHPLAKNHQVFANMVNVAFQHRRKTIKNALEGLVPATLFDSLEIDPKRRPETLSVSEFVNISNSL